MCPGGHGSAMDEELLAHAAPDGHVVQEVMPARSAYTPPGHAVHVEMAPMLNVPVGQLKHVVAAVDSDANVPGAH
jgi:hypothetical protein